MRGLLTRTEWMRCGGMALVIAGLFVVVWIVAILYWRLGTVERSWRSATARAAVTSRPVPAPIAVDPGRPRGAAVTPRPVPAPIAVDPGRAPGQVMSGSRMLE